MGAAQHTVLPPGSEYRRQRGSCRSMCSITCWVRRSESSSGVLCAAWGVLMGVVTLGLQGIYKQGVCGVQSGSSAWQASVRSACLCCVLVQ